MRLALAQINTVVGDLDGNRAAHPRAARGGARRRAPSSSLFPELAVTGYPPEDLLLRPGFVRAAAASLREIAAETKDVVAVVGFPHFDKDLFNACAVCADGEVKASTASGSCRTTASSTRTATSRPGASSCCSSSARRSSA